jgi:outer membrane protein insertion porin family
MAAFSRSRNLTRPPVRSFSPPRLFALALVLAFGWLCASPALAQFEGETISDVVVEGLVSYSQDQIKSGLKTKAGQAYRPIDAQDDLQALARIMRTASISVEPVAGGQVLVRFRVSEFPRLRAIQAIGNVKVSQERIEALLKMKPGETVLDAATVESARRALEGEYRERGMPQAQVKVNLIDAPAPPGAEGQPARPEADLQIVVDEGEQILCKSIEIRGNHFFSTIRLKAVVQTNGSWLFVKNYYDDRQFEDDLSHIRDLYAAYGFFDVRVRRGAFEISGGSVSPVIEIEEGERYTLGEVNVRGARLYSQAEIEAPFEPLKGKLFDGQGFAAALNKVQSLYADHGLLTTEIRPDYVYDTANHRLNLQVSIAEGNRFYVNKIRLVRPNYKPEEGESWFRGWYDRMAPPVGDQTVVKELLLAPGDIYNRRLERDSLHRLQRLGVFDQDSLKIHDEPTQDPDLHDMVVEARDAVTGSLTGGVGFGDATGAFIYASLNEANVGGRADVFSFGVSLGSQSSSVAVSYLKRHLNDTRDTLSTRVAYEISTQPGYNADIAGVNVEWGHPLADDWTRYLRARIEAVDMSERSGYHAAENLNRLYPAATLRLRFEQDTREPYGGPVKEGYLQSVGLEAGYAGGPLAKLEATRDQYRPLSERLTWRLYANAGLMPYDASVVPIQERFFLGGNTDMRGYAYRGAGYFDRNDKSVPIGGAAKVLVKNELIFPLFSPVSGVVFADVGDLGQSPFQWQVPRVTTGVGLRFQMRQVSVGLDLAAPLISQGADKTRFFHFSLQSQF